MTFRDKFNRHVGKDAVVEIGGDQFVFKPLTFADLGEFYEVREIFGRIQRAGAALLVKGSKRIEPVPGEDPEATALRIKEAMLLLDDDESQRLFKQVEFSATEVQAVSNLVFKWIRRSYPAEIAGSPSDEEVKAFISANLLELAKAMVASNVGGSKRTEDAIKVEEMKEARKAALEKI